MATSVSRLHAQIAKLQQQADALKLAAVKRVQREIELHGLTAEDLFGNGTSTEDGRRAKSTTPTKAKKAVGTKSAKAPKYGDSAGNTWGGMGKRPQWLKDALEQGASLEDFLLGAAAKPARSVGKAAKKVKKETAPATRSAAKKPAAKAPGKRRTKRAVEEPRATASE